MTFLIPISRMFGDLPVRNVVARHNCEKNVLIREAHRYPVTIDTLRKMSPYQIHFWLVILTCESLHGHVLGTSSG